MSNAGSVAGVSEAVYQEGTQRKLVYWDACDIY